MEDDSEPYQLIPKREESIDNSRGGIIRRGMQIKGFELIGMPQSVKAFFDLFQSKENHAVVIWMDDDNFVYNSRYENAVTSSIQECIEGRYLLKVRWQVYNKDFDQELSIWSRAGQHTSSRCWDDLFQLSLESLSCNFLKSYLIGRGAELCPFSCEILEKFIVQGPKKECVFIAMIFTPSQCRTLATSGKKTKLDFRSCRFQDDGLAFMDAYILPENQDLGPTKLKIESCALFGDPMLIACLNKLQELSLFYNSNLSPELLRRLVSAELNFLELWQRRPGDVEAVKILINNIREGCGPKGISLNCGFLGSKANLLNFLNALSYLNGHQYLKSLTLMGCGAGRWWDPKAEKAFLAAWTKDLGLRSVTLARIYVTETFWSSFQEQIPLQPSLRKLDLDMFGVSGSTATKKERTEHLVNVILANEGLEQMDCICRVFDLQVWQKLVIPALAHNKHRERFAAVETIGDCHARTAVLAEALITVSGRPSLLYALLHRNLNVVGELVYRPYLNANDANHPLFLNTKLPTQT